MREIIIDATGSDFSSGMPGRDTSLEVIAQPSLRQKIPVFHINEILSLGRSNNNTCCDIETGPCLGSMIQVR